MRSPADARAAFGRALPPLSIALLVSACVPAAQPQVEDAWIRPAAPGMEVMAGYLSIANPTRRDLTIVGVDSVCFGRVELHETRLSDGIVRMRAVQQVELPRGQRIDFAPGGLHLMLLDPCRALAAGDRATLRLSFDDGSHVEFDALVTRGPPR